jgi:hypothetical protein
MVPSFRNLAAAAKLADGVACLVLALGFGSPKREPKPKLKARFGKAIKSFPKLAKAARFQTVRH